MVGTVMTDVALFFSINSVFDPANGKDGFRLLIQNLNARFSELPSEDWLAQVSHAIQYGSILEERSNLVRGAILQVVKDKWEEIPLEQRHPHYEYRDWAIAKTGRDWKTIDAWRRVAQTLYFNDVYLPENVVVKDNGDTKQIPFNPEEVVHSKLIAARSRIESGELTESQWGALADPQVGWSEFVGMLHDGHNDGHVDTSRVRMIGHIMVRDFGHGEVEEILEFDPIAFEDEKNRIHKDIQAIMSFMRVK